MESIRRLIVIFLPWMISSICIYVAASMDHLKPVQLAAFIALFLAVFFFVLSYRSIGAQQKIPKYGVRISAWATIVAGILYLTLSNWWR